MLSDSIRNYAVFFLSVLLISIDVLKLLLLSFDRNQNEARTRGGLQAFCELLRTTMDDKVSLLSFGSSRAVLYFCLRLRRLRSIRTIWVVWSEK